MSKKFLIEKNVRNEKTVHEAEAVPAFSTAAYAPGFLSPAFIKGGMERKDLYVDKWTTTGFLPNRSHMNPMQYHRCIAKSDHCWKVYEHDDVVCYNPRLDWNGKPIQDIETTYMTKYK